MSQRLPNALANEWLVLSRHRDPIPLITCQVTMDLLTTAMKWQSFVKEEAMLLHIGAIGPDTEGRSEVC